MYWTLELASHLEDAPWPATKDELIDYAIRSGAPVEVIENLQALEPILKSMNSSNLLSTEQAISNSKKSTRLS